ncbi:hypothetical protein [Rhizobium esperanzae]|nr:hypothetical protein [Rhizobium esperanzae]
MARTQAATVRGLRLVDITLKNSAAISGLLHDDDRFGFMEYRNEALPT